jgi:long-chain acyl-CoA synthetase
MLSWEDTMHDPTVDKFYGVMTTIGMLENTVSRTGDKVAMRFYRDRAYQELTYSEVLERVDRFAAVLMSMGVESGQRVGVIGENRPEWAITYLAIHRAGATVVPLDSLAKLPELTHIIQDAEVGIVVASERFVPDLLDIRERVKSPETIVSMDEPDRDDVLHMQALMDSVEVPDSFPEVDLEDLAAIIYTSGTTGRSKGVMLTQKNLGSDAAYSAETHVMGHQDIFLSVLPLHHTFECTGGFLIPLYSGASITYARSLKSRDIIDDIKATNVTILLGVPLLFDKMMLGISRKLDQAPPVKRAIISTLFALEKIASTFTKKPGTVLFRSLRDKAGLATLQTMVAGGAALSPRVAKWFTSLGFDIIQGYGLTETSPVINVGVIGSGEHASVGPPLESVEMRILDPDEESNGEVLVRGPMIMKGYYKNEEATREVLDEDGWFHTGDIGHLSDRGWLYITGRKKNVIVTASGKNVYPEEIEDELNRSRSVLESLVLGEPLPESTSEEVAAIVVPDLEHFEEMTQARGEAFTTEEIEKTVRSECRGVIADLTEYKRPKRVDLREDEFEKTSTKKIKRFMYKK